MKILHDGCYLMDSEIAALWSEKYSDPKFDSECYIARALFKYNPTILTLANFPTKDEADKFIKELYDEADNG